MTRLHEISRTAGKKSKRKRIGRGNGSGKGTYSGRGLKGQKQRESINPLFEGGQTPLIKKLPHMRGFNNLFKISYIPINLDVLNSFDDGSEINIQSLVDKKVLRNRKSLVKVLGRGSLSKKLIVSAHSFSVTAEKKIKKAGGEVIRLT
ncbi:MAG: 50S ribosomal protein L15 [Chloroflexi bacterium]|nr:50S ribosomal protein L15 [Chloroflexota bacterium]|tara:strand:- start:1461 stop:1904 length:444 start_codon:yes stop_codon:yes gene_type:complete